MADAQKQKFGDFFDILPDDLVVSVLCRLSSSSESPSDLFSCFLACKRLKRLGQDPLVLRCASKGSLAIRAKNWSPSAYGFLKRCSDSGNLEASFIFGMINFYCLERRKIGKSRMARAALGSHAEALHSLGVISFNGTGGDKTSKDAEAGFALCVRAAALGHVGAICEVGYCLKDGYGTKRNEATGEQFLMRACTYEFVGCGSSHLSSAVVADPHPANRFLVEWFRGRAGELRVCSQEACGRRESRRREFRKCAVCSIVCYCSRACQARDWRVVHKYACRHVGDMGLL